MVSSLKGGQKEKKNKGGEVIMGYFHIAPHKYINGEFAFLWMWMVMIFCINIQIIYFFQINARRILCLHLGMYSI